ncbi:YwaF family protein [Metamycoplasma hyosynoviae]|uniref:TMEM164 family acyltransferase n=1 Tax=Metamycoplasma hyosynoviae TaxID=29559 RepID=UPI0023671BF0|nr:YwaF family protein [Metamycoplasma hyosynoviae]MDD7897450.1 YwaF family protein [Metamycoplasma hyosynoviae]
MVKLLQFLDRDFASGEPPKAFKTFHLIFLFSFLVFAIVLSIILYKSRSEKVTRLVVGLSWMVLVVVEIFKQIYATGHIDKNGKVYWTYEGAAYAIPLVLCSMPLYFIPMYLISWNKKVRKVLLDFICVYNLYGGAFVMMIYPGDVFTKNIFISFHTMIFHGTMLFIGIFLLWTQRVKMSFRTILNTFIILCMLWIVAIVGNEFFYQLHKAKKINVLVDILNISHRRPNPFAATIAQIVPGVKDWMVTAFYPLFTLMVCYTIFTVFWAAWLLIPNMIEKAWKKDRKIALQLASKKRREKLIAENFYATPAELLNTNQ